MEKIIDVPDETKQHIFEDVKKEFYKYVECLAIVPLKQMPIMIRYILM